MTRQTSIDVYHDILNDGTLPACRKAVYKALHKIGKPSTAREIHETMDISKMEPTRLTELRNWGVIYEHEIRKCTVTKRNVIAWWVTDGLPVRPTKVISDKPPGFQKVMYYIIDIMEKTNTKFFTLVDLKAKYGKKP